MKHFLTLLCCMALAVTGIAGDKSGKLTIADPYILTYGGRYYAYGTGGPAPWGGISCFVSDDLKTWKLASQALNPDDSYGETGFWAPEVYPLNGKFYMFYTAQEHICVAVSDSPEGPFIQAEKKPVREERCIDSSLFIDEDGTPYIYFVRFTGGNVIWCAEMTSDYQAIKEETLTECIRVSEPWELAQDFKAKVAEGPSVFKRNGRYYLLYSANHFKSKEYGVGLAVADNPFGPWKKSKSNPVLQHVGGLQGTGHGAPFTDLDGRMKYVFHSHLNDSVVAPRVFHITDMKVRGKKVVMGKDCLTPVYESGEMYSNPVSSETMPDPSVVKADDGWFYAYATARNVSIMKSRDLVHWEKVGTAFTDETRPSFEPKASIWAPDVTRVGDKYVMYYSMSVWGGEWTCGIGCAVSDNPEGPFIDKGKMFRSNEIGVKNSIDPFYIEENGHKYLFWGSFRGIFRIELTDDGLAVRPGCEPVQVAGTAYEGTYIHKHNGKYYFFASVGSCCAGVKSTYKTVVGRSDSLFGPYVDKQGRPMMENHHEVLIHGDGHFVGTGHNSEIVTDEAGNDWMLYHSFVVDGPKGRVLMMDRIEWKDGWPYVKASKPSSKAPVPVIGL